MSNQSKFDVELTKLNDIVITKAAITNESSLPSIDFKKNTIHYSYAFDFAVSEDYKSFRVIFTCKIRVIDKDTSKEINVSAEFDIAYIFSVSNLHDLIPEKSPENMKMDADLVISLANIVYSTSRGVLFTRCQGTVLNKVVLPILSTKNLIEIFNKKYPE